jgi:hypothetical protein
LSAGQVEGSLALLHCLEEQASIDALVGVLMQETAATAQK